MNFLAKPAVKFWTEEKGAQRLSLVLAIALTIGIAYQASRLTWLFIPSPKVTTQAPLELRQAPTAQGPRGAPVLNPNQVASMHLFGDAKKIPVAKKIEPRNVEVTKLNLSLKGIFFNEDPKMGRAIIADPSGKESFYRVGDTITAGTTLDQVFKDRVILMRNGTAESLMLPEDIPTAARSSAPVARHTTVKSSSNAPSFEAEFTKSYREELLKNPMELANVIGAAPAKRGDEQIGFRVTPGKDPELFRKMGLRSGDIITAIGGIPLNDSDGAGLALDRLATSDNVEISILRRGRPRSIVVSFNE